MGLIVLCTVMSYMMTMSTGSSSAGASIADFPSVVTLIDDDYPYQCVCTCEDQQVLGTCEYNKATTCYCDYTPPAKTSDSAVVNSF